MAEAAEVLFPERDRQYTVEQIANPPPASGGRGDSGGSSEHSKATRGGVCGEKGCRCCEDDWVRQKRSCLRIVPARIRDKMLFIFVVVLFQLFVWIFLHA